MCGSFSSATFSRAIHSRIHSTIQRRMRSGRGRQYKARSSEAAELPAQTYRRERPLPSAACRLSQALRTAGGGSRARPTASPSGSGELLLAWREPAREDGWCRAGQGRAAHRALLHELADAGHHLPHLLAQLGHLLPHLRAHLADLALDLVHLRSEVLLHRGDLVVQRLRARVGRRSVAHLPSRRKLTALAGSSGLCRLCSYSNPPLLLRLLREQQ